MLLFVAGATVVANFRLAKVRGLMLQSRGAQFKISREHHANTHRTSNREINRYLGRKIDKKKNKSRIRSRVKIAKREARYSLC